MKRAVCPARTAACTMFLASMVFPSPCAPTRSTLSGRSKEIEREDPLQGGAVEGGGPVPIPVGQGFEAAEPGRGEAAFDTAPLAVLEFGGDDALEQHRWDSSAVGCLRDEIVEVVGGARPVEPSQVTRQGRRGRVG